ncbi:phosphonate ABC transporter, permease protein PhnE [Glutamicibacter endophyticus]|uniref:phosphonate ABC transporter, permease protein PhnE n=1 Tax=Glutamicibacter sp. PS TaxID=3075634 RepID=UPI0028503D29|nr:phosphonate ABC transporter, permease protein PhnE [Glutamicibacter sp. PS]MDR4533787.1 phosphonate ABC transporter, permease protein PhnE [Glutamicibacter sp. PS]
MSQQTFEIRRSHVPPRPRAVSRWTTAGISIAVLVTLHVVALRDTGFRISELIAGAEGMGAFLSDAFPADFDWDTVLAPALAATATTLWIGLLGTTLSIPAALLLAVLGSRTTSGNKVVYQLARALLSFFRAVPDVVFALIFVTAVGLGPFAGVLALICHNTGVMGKLWAEALEESDQGPQQALGTAGATRLQQVMHASLPMVTGSFVGLLLYRFDVNVRSSLVLGLVGAGGIGLLINQSIKSFQFDAMVTQILVVLVLIILVDQLSAFIRKRVAV